MRIRMATSSGKKTDDPKKAIHIDITEITESVLPDLFAEIPDICSVSLKGDGLEHISVLTKYKIQHLSIHCTNVNFSPLLTIKGLKHLTVNRVDVGILSRLPELERLTLTSPNSPDVFYSIPRSLKFLTLSSHISEPIDYDRVPVNSTLISLTLRQTENIDFIDRFTALKFLRINFVRGTPLNVLQRLPTLKRVTLSHVESDLHLPSGIVHLTISYTNLENLAFLYDLSELTILDLKNCTLSKTLDQIWSCKQLKRLGLGCCAVTCIDGIEKLADSLTTLNLSHAELVNMSCISSLYRLKALDISDTPTADISFISSLPNLRRILIPSTIITGIHHLFKIKTIYLPVRALKISVYDEHGEIVFTEIRDLRSAVTKYITGDEFRKKVAVYEYVDESVGRFTKAATT